MRLLRLLAPLGFSCSIAASLAEPAFAQRQPSAVSGQVSDYGIFAGLDLRFGDVMGDFGAFVGGHAAILLKHQVYLGVGGAGLATENALFAPTPQATPEPIKMGYGGLLVGYLVPTPSLVDFAVEVLLGAGGVDASVDGGALGSN